MPNWLTRPWFAGQEPTENRSVWLALQTGAAGMPLRIGLSLAAMAAVLSVLMFVLSMIELGGRYRPLALPQPQVD